MRPDLLRLLGALAAAGLVGLALGQVFLCLAAALLSLLLWHYRAARRIHRFLRAGADKELPDIPGVLNEMIREIDSLRAHHRQREDKLSGFLSRFQEATEALPDGVIVADAAGHIEWANRRADAYLGIQCPRDRGQRFSNLVRHPGLPADLREMAAAADAGDARDSVIVASPLRPELLLELRAGRYGESSLLLVARDVTEIQHLNRMRKDFIANASHELRTPLTVIAGYLEAFEDDARDCPPRWRPRIKEMRVQAKRLQNLIADLLTLSRLESGPAAAREEVHVAELLEAIRKEATALSGAAGHRLSLQADPALRLTGDRGDLYSAFSNIVFNAVQYTAAGGEARIQWARRGRRACFAVRDSGEGIAAEHLGRVTERFYRVKQARGGGAGGTGLGLAIVKHVMARHDAELRIDSEPGRGTTVTCLFPASRVAAAGKTVAAEKTAASG